MNRLAFGICGALVTLLMFGQTVAQTPVPQVIKIQGFLADDQGVPIDGPISITFHLYDAVTGGNLINSVGPLAVQVTEGIYSADLGFGPADFAGQDRFLQHTVNGEVLSPRTQIVSVPYAYRAEGGSADPDQQEIKDKLCEISVELGLTLPAFCTPQVVCPCEGLTKGIVVWDSSFPTSSCVVSTPTTIVLFGTPSFQRLAALGDPGQFNCNVWDGADSPNAIAYTTEEEAQACADRLIAIAAEDGVICN